ncbi:hypothetical protein NSQ93_22500 [Bacillus sp. FSL W8-0445]|uniref:hypothetical protein n=1 Tax=Bacillota TaxID=1239 RepID=UPI000779E207|nr:MULTISPECIES: hypothetical protein [Bacillota]MDE1407019.1 hypothetical protein [Bacillus licheniformis]NFT30587.1 hypothetical protein [Clostridium sporogenes]GIN25529.1 hypothetical protein J31TS2_21090 [Bacillus licheniformis]GIN29732.1 hypothetical protein J2TS5_17710 [Bacillus licheniformis]
MQNELFQLARNTRDLFNDLINRGFHDPELYDKVIDIKDKHFKEVDSNGEYGFEACCFKIGYDQTLKLYNELDNFN